MPLTDEEMVDRYGHEKSAYNALADYAASQRTGLLPRMREHALEKNGLPSSEGLMHEPATMAQKHYSNGDAYTDTMFGWDTFSYLENLCRARAMGLDYAQAAERSLNGMNMCQSVGLIADMSLLENEIESRDYYMAPFMEESDLGVIERGCLVDAELALLLAEKHLDRNHFLHEGHEIATNIAYEDIHRAASYPSGIKCLPQSIKDCPETELLERFSTWLGGQRALSQVLKHAVKTQALKQGYTDDSFQDSLRVSNFYQKFCASLWQYVREDLNDGLYVYKFSEASRDKSSPEFPLNLGNNALYKFVKEVIEDGMKNDALISDHAQSFARAANHLMQEFSREFPVISTVSEPSAKKISLEIT